MTAFGIRLADIPDNVAISIRLVHAWNGSWLAAYDPDARDGIGEATFTDMPGDALRFDTFDEAQACWYQQSTVRPAIVPAEGAAYENRPLAVLSIVIDELPD